MFTCEKQRGICDPLMERDDWIKWDVEIEERFAQFGDRVTTHGEQQEREGEGHNGGCSTSHTHPLPRDTPEALVLLLHRVIWVKKTTGTAFIPNTHFLLISSTV